MQDARISAFAAAAFAVLVASGNAYAVQQLTYVATYGSDANSCSLAQPCRSFAGALAQTSDGGQIFVLDSGGYGPVLIIDKSVSIVAPDGVYAGISVFFPNAAGVNINTSGRVRLSGLTIVGFGGTVGVAASAGSLHLTIERTTINGFEVAIALCCAGINGEAVVRDTTLYSNVQAVTSLGWKTLFERTRVLGNGAGGIVATYDTRTTITDSMFAMNIGGYAVYVESDQPARVSVNRSVFTDNTGGLAVRGRVGSDVTASLRRDAFVRNGTGLSVGAGFDDDFLLRADAAASVFSDNHTAITVSHDVAKLTVAGNTIVRSAWAGVENHFKALIESRGDNTIRNNLTDGGPFVPLPGL